jgi:hypothetical protein
MQWLNDAFGDGTTELVQQMIRNPRDSLEFRDLQVHNPCVCWSGALARSLVVFGICE